MNMMEARFLEEGRNASKSPIRGKKRSKSKDRVGRKGNFGSASTADVFLSTKTSKFSAAKLSKNSDMLEINLAKFNSMLTFSVLKSKHWTRETFYDTTYCSLLEQFIELVPKINQRKSILFHCPDFVKGLFEMTFKLLKHNS